MAILRGMSPKRQEMARMVEDGRVRYDTPTWLIDDTEAGGWDGRTLREMRRDGLIEIDEGSGKVTLTSVGVDQLAASAPPGSP